MMKALGLYYLSCLKKQKKELLHRESLILFVYLTNSRESYIFYSPSTWK